MKTIISIIIPVYNAQNYIGRCIESLQSQSLSEVEIICVDDASQDNSIAVVEGYKESDKRIKLIEIESNSGPMVARTIGYKSAKGRYIMFCDADDTVPADALNSLYEKAINTDADIVSGNIEIIHIDGRKTYWYNSLKYGHDKISGLRSLLKGEMRHNICSKLFKSSLLQNLEYSSYANMNYAEDYLLMMQCAYNSNVFACVDTVVYRYHQVETSSTNIGYTDRRVECEFFAYKNVFDLLSGYETLKKDLISSCQKSFSRIMSVGYDISKYVEKYEMKDIMTINSILKYNSGIEALKIIIKKNILYKLNRKNS